MSEEYAIYSDEKSWDRFFAHDLHNGFSSMGVASRLERKYNFHLEKHDKNYILRALKRCIVICRNDGGFYIINHHDRYDSFLYFIDIILSDKCHKVFQCQYRDWQSMDIISQQSITKEIFDRKISPFIYMEKDPLSFREVDKLKLAKEPVIKKLYFRGDITAHDARRMRVPVLKGLNDILISDYDRRLSRDDFLNEVNRAKINLSLPGNGNFCHREIECFALEKAILSPRFLNHYYHDLIPDHHYVSVDINWEKDETNKKVDMIRNKFYEVINDDEYIEFVGTNACQWYQDNIIYPNNVKIALDIILSES